jgi:hypothetical protein
MVQRGGVELHFRHAAYTSLYPRSSFDVLLYNRIIVGAGPGSLSVADYGATAVLLRWCATSATAAIEVWAEEQRSAKQLLA